MLSATWRGMAAHRRAFLSAGFSLGQRATLSCQVMSEYYINHPQGKEPN
jgi:hypothetical protein